MCDMTHSYVRQDSFVCATEVISIFAVALICAWSFSYWYRHPVPLHATYAQVSSLHMEDTFICVTLLIYMCDMTHSYVWHDLFICTTWLIHMWVLTHPHVRHDSFVCATWRIYIDMTHWYVRHDAFISHPAPPHATYTQYQPFIFAIGLIHTFSFISATWRIQMCDVTRLYVRCDSLISEIQRLSMQYTPGIEPSYDTTHSFVRHDRLCAHSCNNNKKWSCHAFVCGNMTDSYMGHGSFICATWLIRMCDMSTCVTRRQSYVRHDSVVQTGCKLHVEALDFDTNLAHMNASRCTQEGVMPQIALDFGKALVLGLVTSHCLYEWAVSHIWLRHVTHMNESRHACIKWLETIREAEAVLWVSHVTQMTESRHTYDWLRHTYDCIMSHNWLRHVTHMNASRHTYDCATSHRRASDSKTIRGAESDVHMYIIYSSIYVCICVNGCVWMSHTYDTAWLRHVTHLNVSRHAYACGTSHIWLTVSRQTTDCVMSLIWLCHVAQACRCHTNDSLCHVTQLNASHHTCKWVTS